MSEAATTRRSDVRHEPRFESPRPAPGGADPLAELARLVGQDDPFRSVFRTDAEPAIARIEPRPASPGRTDPRAFPQAPGEPSEHDGDGHHAHPAAAYDEAYEAYDDGYAHEGQPPHEGHERAADEHDLAHSEHPDAHDAYGHDVYAQDPYAHEADAYAEPSRHHAPTPDVWAEGEVAPVPLSAEDGPEGAAARRRTSHRPLVVLAAVLVLTGGGLAATFFARAGSGTGVARDAPTIMAASGPTKVKLADPTMTAPEDADAALLNKSGAVPRGPAKVVSSQEQPIDLAQLPKSAAKADAAASAIDGGDAFFPQPKKVKTFVVRPDGTMVGAPAVAPPAPQAEQPNVMPMGMGDLPAPNVAPRAGTPKTTARAATTPKVTADTTIADLAQTASGGAAPKVRQPASPGVHAAPKSKPVEVAEADTGVTTAGGSFGLQLAAAPNEQDARDAFSRMQKKFSSQLGSMKPTIRKAENGDKTVYRLRVGSLSQDEAKTLCSQLQAGGGTCYVVHN